VATPSYLFPVITRETNALESAHPMQIGVVEKAGGPPVERRSNQRFELPLEFDLFQLRGASRLAWYSSGTTIDWSRNSVLLRSGRNLGVGSSAQLVVRWTAGVQLIIVGRVIRCDERGMVLRILRRRFRGKPVLIVSLSHLIHWTQSQLPAERELRKQ
jgi:hypothetical protein